MFLAVRRNIVVSFPTCFRPRPLPPSSPPSSLFPHRLPRRINPSRCRILTTNAIPARASLAVLHAGAGEHARTHARTRVIFPFCLANGLSISSASCTCRDRRIPCVSSSCAVPQQASSVSLPAWRPVASRRGNLACYTEWLPSSPLPPVRSHVDAHVGFHTGQQAKTE